MSAEHFKEIEKKYPIIEKSPDGLWEYKVEYEQGWGGYILHYSWHSVSEEKWDKHKDLYYISDYADGISVGYTKIEWEVNDGTTLIFTPDPQSHNDQETGKELEVIKIKLTK